MIVELMEKTDRPYRYTLSYYKDTGLFRAQADNRVILSVMGDGRKIVLFDNNKISVITDAKTIVCWENTNVEPYKGTLSISNESST